MCEGAQRSLGEDLEGGYEIGVTLEEELEDMSGCEISAALAVERIEDDPLKSNYEGSKCSEILSSEDTVKADETHDLGNGDSLVLGGGSRLQWSVKPEGALTAQSEESVTASVGSDIEASTAPPVDRDCVSVLELKEDEEFLLPLKNIGDVLLPVKEDEENLLPVKEDAANVLTLEEDKEMIQPGAKGKLALGEGAEVHLSDEEDENLFPVREDEENLIPVDEDAEIPFSRGKEKMAVAVEDVDDILLPKTTDKAPELQDDYVPTLKDKEEAEQQQQTSEAAAVPPPSASPPLDWDDDGAEGWDPEVEEMIGNQGGAR